MDGGRVPEVPSELGARRWEQAITNLDLWVDRLVAMRQRPIVGGLIGLGIYGFALGLRMVTGAVMDPYPFLVFFPAVLATAILGGTWPAIVIAVLSGVTSWFMFMSPSSFWAERGSNVLGVVFFALVTSISILMIEGFYWVAMRLREERQRAEQLLASREAMFKEMQHRVANNMQFIAGLLSIQQKRLEGTPAEPALEEAASRVRAMARIHRRLHDPTTSEAPLGPLIEDLCHELIEATGAKNIVCRVDIPPITLPMDRIVALTMIVNEALTNTVKHAYPDGRHGTIRISLKREDTDQLALRIADDGKGLPAGFDAANAQSLGMRIFQALATQLQGALSFADRNPGAELQLRFQA